MFDTHAIARSLTNANLTVEQADAITAAIASAAEHGDHATRADLQALRAEMAAMESRLTWRLVGAMTAIGAILRFIG